jgi:hypothetical protein
VAGRPRCFVARTALKEDQEGALAALRLADLPGKDREPVAVGPGMIQGDSELVLDEDEAGDVAELPDQGIVGGLSRRVQWPRRRLRRFL